MIRLVSIFSVLLPIVFFLLHRRRNQEKKLWVIFIYCCISLLVDVSYKHFGGVSKNREFEVYSFITIVEYMSLFLFYYFTYANATSKKILIGCSVFFFIILAYNILYNYNNDEDFDSLPASAEAVFVVVFSILYFYEQINNPNVTFIYGTKSFWIVVAFLLYLAVNLFPFIARSLVTDKEFTLVYQINYIANILKNVMFAIAFRMVPAKVN